MAEIINERNIAQMILNRMELLLERAKKKFYVFNIKNKPIISFIDNDFTEWRTASYINKEPETLAWIEKFFHPGDTIFDIGANLGFFGIYAAKHLNGQCKVFSFEPEGMNYSYLSHNIYLNGLSGIVIPCCLAITDRLYFDFLNLNREQYVSKNISQGLVAGSALHTFGEAVDFRGNPFTPFHKQGMVGVSLDHFCYEWKQPIPNHLKIDVDGIEEKIIDGSYNLLRDERLRTVIIEVTKSNVETEPMFNKIVDAGFQEYNEIPTRINTIFVRK